MINLTNRTVQSEGWLALVWGPKKNTQMVTKIWIKSVHVSKFAAGSLPGSCPPWPDPRRWCSRTPEHWCWSSIGGCVRSPGRSAESTPSPLQDTEEDTDVYTASMKQNRNNTVQYNCKSLGFVESHNIMIQLLTWKIKMFFFPVFTLNEETFFSRFQNARSNTMLLLVNHFIL